jgi:hypothetical protein
MKKVFVLLFTLIGMNTAHSQVQSDCTVPPELSYRWFPDINHLALCRIFEINSPDTNLVRIPDIYCDTIAQGMAAIVNARFVIPEADSIFNIYCVHNIYGCVSNNYNYLVNVDTNFAWTKSWQNHETMTGEPLMDTILTRYDLHVINFHYWSNKCVAVLYTESIWNIYALCDSLELVDGVNSTEVNSNNMDGNRIDYYFINGERLYDFSLEWGDCIAGCIWHYTWKFKVNSDCQVKYLGNENNIGQNLELPPPINCNWFLSEIEHAQPLISSIYPNPSSNFITVSSTAFIENTQLSIFNISGKKVMERQLNGNETQINISALPRGVYFVRLQNEKMVEVGKMVKQ